MSKTHTRPIIKAVINGVEYSAMEGCICSDAIAAFTCPACGCNAFHVFGDPVVCRCRNPDCDSNIWRETNKQTAGGRRKRARCKTKPRVAGRALCRRIRERAQRWAAQGRSSWFNNNEIICSHQQGYIYTLVRPVFPMPVAKLPPEMRP